MERGVRLSGMMPTPHGSSTGWKIGQRDESDLLGDIDVDTFFRRLMRRGHRSEMDDSVVRNAAEAGFQEQQGIRCAGTIAKSNVSGCSSFTNPG